ncbi:MAG: YeeE/YedE family protein [Alphaproteobacteria bacterium]|nr:YeeE/YedE family protein [Alphaproteobacteria bacterium]
MENFTPVASTIGGVLIGLSAVMMLAFQGRIAGISGIFGTLLRLPAGDTAWRAFFVTGLLAGGLVFLAFQPEAFVNTTERSYGAVAVAGLLVGFGTRLGSGCTSGHGVCGLSRLAPRSFAATGTFMAFGALSAFIVNHLLGGAL